jgi:N-acetylmuramoyl-L-alanine amidase
MVGSSGADVTALQQLLVQLGFLQVTPTGYFGAMTKTALQKYQSAHGISPVGYAGPLTRTSLSLGK